MKRTPKSKRQLTQRKLPTECLCCGASNPWVTQTIPQIVKFRDQTHTIFAEVTQCRHCDTVTTTAEQDARMITQTRPAHCDWIKNTILSARKILQLSHRDFSEVINIGSATLSRAVKAESVIDASTEELLLLKIDQLIEDQEKQTLLNLQPQTFLPITEKNLDLSTDWDLFATDTPLALAG